MIFKPFYPTSQETEMHLHHKYSLIKILRKIINAYTFVFWSVCPCKLTAKLMLTLSASVRQSSDLYGQRN